MHQVLLNGCGTRKNKEWTGQGNPVWQNTQFPVEWQCGQLINEDSNQSIQSTNCLHCSAMRLIRNGGDITIIKREAHLSQRSISVRRRREPTANAIQTSFAFHCQTLYLADIEQHLQQNMHRTQQWMVLLLQRLIQSAVYTSS